MGMCTHVVGLREIDDEWRKMKAVWDACEAAVIDPPGEVTEFFEDRHPDETVGIEVDLPEGAVREWKADMKDGFEIVIAELPSNVKVVRFYNSY